MANLKLPHKLYSYFLVFSQFGLLFILAINTSLVNVNLYELLISLSGILLGVWAVWVMKKSKLSVLPDVVKDATLIKSGPYRFIRHPMYSGVLLFCLGMLFTNITIIGILSFFSLFIILSFKVKYEEKQLIKTFSNYKEYMLVTKRLIPFII